MYNASTTGLLDNTTSPRGLVGVVLHAHIGSGGAPTNWSVLQRSPVGDPRGSSQNNLALEFLGDYVYADATNDYGVAVWNDVRNAADCPAVDAWRAALQLDPSTDPAGRPAVQQNCPATFGNTDIYGGAFADPTPRAYEPGSEEAPRKGASFIPGLVTRSRSSRPRRPGRGR